MDDKDKQVMFSDIQGFYQIKNNLETEISLLWINGELTGAYNRIKMLYRHVLAHLKNRKISDTIEPKFKEAEKYIFDPRNGKEYPTRIEQINKNKRFNEADKIMDNIFKQLKKEMKESKLELPYGIPIDIINRNKRDANLSKVFGRKI